MFVSSNALIDHDESPFGSIFLSPDIVYVECLFNVHFMMVTAAVKFFRRTRTMVGAFIVVAICLLRD